MHQKHKWRLSLLGSNSLVPFARCSSSSISLSSHCFPVPSSDGIKRCHTARYYELWIQHQRFLDCCTAGIQGKLGQPPHFHPFRLLALALRNGLTCHRCMRNVETQLRSSVGSPVMSAMRTSCSARFTTSGRTKRAEMKIFSSLSRRN